MRALCWRWAVNRPLKPGFPVVCAACMQHTAHGTARHSTARQLSCRRAPPAPRHRRSSSEQRACARCSTARAPAMADARLHARPAPHALAPAGSARGAGPPSSAASAPAPAAAAHELAGQVTRLDVAHAGGGGWHGDRGAFLYAPPDWTPAQPSPLLVMLHGAGGHAHNTLRTFGSLRTLDASRCLLLVPESRGATWDVIRGGFGPDVAFIDRALQRVFERCAVDSTRVCLAGFSDGASYALSLGLPNGDLFSHVMALSPGFMRPPRLVGSPRVLVTHGVSDEVLPISCSRRLVPRLAELLPGRAALAYLEFAGGHTVTERLAAQALAWFLTDALVPGAAIVRGGGE